MFQEYSSLELLLEGILPAKFLLKTAASMEVRLSLRSRESEASNLRASTRSVRLICHGTDTLGSRRTMATLVKGFGVTLRNLWRKPITENYPHEPVHFH